MVSLTTYSETTLRKRARKAGYQIKKGFQRWTVGGGIWTDIWGEHRTGYIVIDPTGWAVYGSFNESVTHAWQLADVEKFLKEVYESNGLKW